MAPPIINLLRSYTAARTRRSRIETFENALIDLIENHMDCGLLPEEVTLVLKARADDNFAEYPAVRDAGGPK